MSYGHRTTVQQQREIEKMELQKQIVELREKHNLKVTAVAKRLGITNNKVCAQYAFAKYEQQWGIKPHRLRMICPHCPGESMYVARVLLKTPHVVFKCDTCDQQIKVRLELVVEPQVVVDECA